MSNSDTESRVRVYLPEDVPSITVSASLGIQHVLAMFGATVLAPVLMGFDPNTAILFSGIATILFVIVTRRKVPSYLGSSFAFIAAVGVASGYSGTGLNPNLPIALGGIVVCGLIYGAVSLIVLLAGYRWIEAIFPDLVSGTIVGIIGISLAGVAIAQIGKDVFGILAALFTLAVVVLWGVYAPGRIARGRRGDAGMLRIIEVIPVIIGGVAGYVFYFVGANLGGLAEPAKTAAISAAPWFGLPTFQVPVFSLQATLTIAPVVIVLLAENLGHVKAIGAMIGKNLNDQVGRTFLGDAIGTTLSASFGGPGLTTYAENMAVMRLSNNFASITFIAAGLFAIALGFSPKFGAIIQSIPAPVLGGLSLAMFGLITAAAGSIWQRGIRSGSINFLETRTLLVAGIGLVCGAGNLVFRIGPTEISGIVSATIITVVLYHLLHIGAEKVSVPVEYE
jgi:putative pyrimidine permease RutG